MYKLSWSLNVTALITTIWFLSSLNITSECSCTESKQTVSLQSEHFRDNIQTGDIEILKKYKSWNANLLEKNADLLENAV